MKMESFFLEIASAYKKIHPRSVLDSVNAPHELKLLTSNSETH
jgi:hypothetical protein